VTESSEQVLQFGPQNQLLGIATLPRHRCDGAPACLLVNAGMVHRIGPRRLYVKMARELAAAGIPSLRLDLSGIGDSRSEGGSERLGEQAVADLRAAMDVLQANYGITRFVAAGVCSGARNAYRLALADERVVGLLMFDAFFYPTFKTRLMPRWQRFRASPWRALVRSLRRYVRAAPTPPLLAYVPEDLPSRDEFARAMNRLVEREVSVYLIYSGGVGQSFNYAAQLRDAFGSAPFLQRVRCAYMPDIDHNVTPLQAQRELIDTVREWVQAIAAPDGAGRRPLSA
jgi:pimeloyl-ACP methyl ester carboxylesterase